MSDAVWALLAGIAAILSIFFGKPFFGLLNKLIDRTFSSGQEVKIQLNACQKRMDQLEVELHHTVLERERLANLVDDYTARSQSLMEDNRQLRLQIAGISARLQKYEDVRA